MFSLGLQVQIRQLFIKQSKNKRHWGNIPACSVVSVCPSVKRRHRPAAGSSSPDSAALTKTAAGPERLSLHSALLAEHTDKSMFGHALFTFTAIMLKVHVSPPRNRKLSTNMIRLWKSTLLPTVGNIRLLSKGSNCAWSGTHQLLHVLLLLCKLLLCTAQPLTALHNLLLQLSNLKTTVQSIWMNTHRYSSYQMSPCKVFSISLCNLRLESVYRVLFLGAGVCCFVAYLCVCPLSVGPGRVVFVSQKSLQLSNSDAHPRHLRPQKQHLSLFFYVFFCSK